MLFANLAARIPDFPMLVRAIELFRSLGACIDNLHDQFEQLRDEGRYEQLRDRIIARDVALAGTVNPMLARHGELSEARQYSGRAVNDDWVCPFTTKGEEITRAR